MNKPEKKKFRNQMKEIKSVNQQFVEFLEDAVQKYPFDDVDQQNTILLQEHLKNMNLIFSSMDDSVKKAK